MSVVDELIHIEGDGTISFGNYLLDTKTKLDNVEIFTRLRLLRKLPSLRRTVCLFMSLYREQQSTTFQ